MNNDKCWNCRKPYTAEARRAADGMCPHCGVEIELADDATPATPGAAETIADDGQFLKLLAREQGWRDGVPVMWKNAMEFVAHIDQRQAAAVAAAREEGRRELEATREAYIAQSARLVDAEEELARLRAAPVVGEAVKPADDEHARLIAAEDKGYASGRRVGLVEGASIIRELYVNHVHADGATGLLARCEQAEQVLYGLIDTAPHAAKEAGKVDEEKPNCRNQGGVCACRSGGSFGGCAMERAALARTTNKEGN